MVNHMRHTRGHTRNRRSHHALTAVGTILCEACGMPRKKHTACSSCGAYKGKNTADSNASKAKAVKAEKKVAKKETKKATKK